MVDKDTTMCPVIPHLNYLIKLIIIRKLRMFIFVSNYYLVICINHDTKKILNSHNISICVALILLLSFGVTPSYSQNFEENQSSMVQITKSSLNTYTIVNDTAFVKPFFDTTYIISGSSSSINSSQDVINSTIINDFLLSPTAGYIIQSNNNTSINGNLSAALSSLPNPFADNDTISKSIDQ
jgi:hypothetical protein